jgi:hypothetical protein
VTTSTPAPTPTSEPTPAPRQYTDQQLQDWAEADAEYAWGKFKLKPGSDHRCNWFEIGMKIEESTETFVARHGLNGTDATVYKKFFEDDRFSLTQRTMSH